MFLIGDVDISIIDFWMNITEKPYTTEHVWQVINLLWPYGVI